MAMTTAERMRAYRARLKQSGKRKVALYLTEEEEERVRSALQEGEATSPMLQAMSHALQCMDLLEALPEGDGERVLLYLQSRLKKIADDQSHGNALQCQDSDCCPAERVPSIEAGLSSEPPPKPRRKRKKKPSKELPA